jgi:UDP-glucose 4-epimerase
VFNLGTGVGYSVLDVVAAFERAAGVPVPRVTGPRRPGDVAVVFSSPKKAKEILGWQAARTLEEMCADSWRWQKNNPNGYED